MRENNDRGKEWHGENWTEQRNLARQRDNYECQLCAAKETTNQHDVHHKIPFATFGIERYLEANDLSNLITLCNSCHGYFEQRMKSEQKKGFEELVIDEFKIEETA